VPTTPKVPLPVTCPGIAWILDYTIASEIGDIARFPTPRKLVGYTGLCPKVDRSTHAAAIDVASGELRRARFGGGTGEVVEWLRGLPQPLRGCYEAGPTGYALYRAAEAAGVCVEVVAPSKTPRPSGDRVKTDRKDAELLARLLLAGQLRAVTVPPVAFEAARHLARAREQVRQDLMRGRHRVSKLLLLHGRVYEAGAWTKTHRRWLEQQRFDESPTELAYADALAAVDGLVARQAALDERLSRLACEGEWWPTVARLRCFRGIDTLTALVLTLEIGDFGRFRRPAQLAAWLGLVPSLNQSGQSETRGPITKTGSSIARRLLVEAAWHYLPQPSVGVALAQRRAGQSAEVLQIALRAQRRLHRLYQRLRQRGKPGNITVAVARELACFLWAAAVV
jgi:transposase